MSPEAATAALQAQAVAPTQDSPPIRKRPRKLAPYFLLIPASVIVLVAMAYPVLWQLVTSMQQFGLAQQFGQPPEWVWLDNYITLFSNPTTWLVVLRSVAFCLAAATATMVVGIAFALLMQTVSTGVRITLQIAMLLAWATPVVAAMTIWNWIFDWRRGLVNWILTSFGLDFNKTENPELAKDLMRIIFSEEYQTMLGKNGLGPANEKYASSLGDDQFAKALIESASNSKLTPAAPGWAAIESKNIMEEFFAQIRDADDLKALAVKTNEKLDALLNQK